MTLLLRASGDPPELDKSVKGRCPKARSELADLETRTYEDLYPARGREGPASCPRAGAFDAGVCLLRVSPGLYGLVEST
jgi:hypothetical protein